MILRSALIIVATMVAAPAVDAHHTVAMTHDISHTVALIGRVTEVQWQNPHVIYHLAVPDASGSLIDWEIESAHLQGMRRNGIEMDTIKVGDTVTMNVLLALDGRHHGATASVTLADGRTVRLCTVTDNRCP
jgi:hypothetical protein